MKALVIATGEIVEVVPNYYDGEIVSWTEQRESGVARIYQPNEVYVDTSEIENERLCEKLRQELNAPEIRYTKDAVCCNWNAIRISAAQYALQGCIISGKPNPVKSAMKYSAELVEALRKELE